jgi:hypothetical protein
VPDEGYREGSLVKSTAAPALVFDGPRRRLRLRLHHANKDHQTGRKVRSEPTSNRGRNSRTKPQAVALLVDARSVIIADTAEVIRKEKVFDPWISDVDGPVTRTVYRREAVLDVDDHLVPRFTEEVCQRIAETLSYVAERNDVKDVAYVRARPALPEVDGDWRTAYAAQLASDRPSNQARRESGGGHPVKDGLTFGSTEEMRIYRALKGLQARRRTPSRSLRSPLSACGQATRGALTSWSWAGGVS